MGVENLAGTLYLDSNTNRQAKVHKKTAVDNPSLGSPCKQGEPRPFGSPREAGGTLRRGAIVNSGGSVGKCLCGIISTWLHRYSFN
jgi:hypothetical protein